MPKPTTHTDVLIPKPDPDNPPRAVRVSIGSVFDTGAIKTETVEILQNDAPSVAAATAIKQTTTGQLLQVEAVVEAHSGMGLKIRGFPEGAASPPANGQDFEWDGVGLLDKLRVHVGGTFSGETLRADFTKGDVTSEESELALRTPAGQTVAEIRVSFSTEF